MKKPTLTPAQQRIINKHGITACIKAYKACYVEGNGATTIAIEHGFGHWATASAAIEAGKLLGATQ